MPPQGENLTLLAAGVARSSLVSRRVPLPEGLSVVLEQNDGRYQDIGRDLFLRAGLWLDEEYPHRDPIMRNRGAVRLARVGVLLAAWHCDVPTLAEVLEMSPATVKRIRSDLPKLARYPHTPNPPPVPREAVCS
jgi:hypothetical protein